MRLLINIGYEKLLLSENANVAAVLLALATATPVEERDRPNYSKPRTYARKTTGDTFEAPHFIHDSQLIEDEVAAEMDADALRKRNDDLRSSNHAMQTELSKLKEQIGKLVSKET